MTTVPILSPAQQRAIAAAAEEVNLARGRLDYVREYWGGHPNHDRARQEQEIGAARCRLVLAEVALRQARGDDRPQPPPPTIPLPRRRSRRTVTP